MGLGQAPVFKDVLAIGGISGYIENLLAHTRRQNQIVHSILRRFRYKDDPLFCRLYGPFCCFIFLYASANPHLFYCTILFHDKSHLYY